MSTRYVAETSKSPAQAVADLEASLKPHGYGVLPIACLLPKSCN